MYRLPPAPGDVVPLVGHGPVAPEALSRTLSAARSALYALAKDSPDAATLSLDRLEGQLSQARGVDDLMTTSRQ